MIDMTAACWIQGIFKKDARQGSVRKASKCSFMYISVITEAKNIFVLYFATADMFYFDVCFKILGNADISAIKMTAKTWDTSGINKNGVT